MVPFAYTSSAFQHWKLSCHRTLARTQTHPLSTAPFALHLRARKSQIQCCPVDLAAAADFCHYSLGVSWGCLSETASALCAAECVDCVKILRMHVHVSLCVCVVGAYDGVNRPHWNRTVIPLSLSVCMSANCNSNNVNIISTINVK